MNKQKKQNLLTVIITILVIVLVMMIGSIVYEEKINMSKQITQNTNFPEVDEDEEIEDELEKENNIVDEEKQEDKIEDEDNQEFVGEEENPIEEVPENPEMTDEEKAIDLVKKQWGEDDSVTFSIAKKKGNKFYVAVKSSNTSNIWYEVNIETWEVSEY